MFFPEPSGLTLEGIDSLFAGGKVTMRRSPRALIDNSELDRQKHHEKSSGVEKGSFMENA